MPNLSLDPYLVGQAIFAPMYLLWAYLWAKVAYYYGQASYVGWLANGGRLRDAIPDVLSPFSWAFKVTAYRLGLLEGDKNPPPPVPHRHENGAILRFAIFLGSLTPVCFGIQFAELDRHGWTQSQFMLTVLFMTSSFIASLTHLFLAMRHDPNGWRRLIVRVALWCILAPVGFYALYLLWPSGIPLI